MRRAKTSGGSPVVFRDRDGRAIRICSYDSGPAADEFEALVDLYCSFGSATRTLGLPPDTESTIREWLGDVAETHTAMAVAWNETEAVGHGFLAPESSREHELAVFVRESHQRAGVGSRLVESLLAVGRTDGIATIVIYVDPLNRAAISFYRELGFTQVGDTGNAIKMRYRL